MQYKYKLVLSLAQELEIPLDEGLQKFIHWYKYIHGINYDFVNGYSFELDNDIHTFQNRGYITEKRFACGLEVKDKIKVQSFKNRIAQGEEFKTASGDISIPNQKTLFTIGYEGKSIDNYLNQLVHNGVKCLVDVRRNAYSDKFGFKKNELQHCLSRCGMAYIHIPELGIETKKRKEAKVGVYKDSSDLPLFNTKTSGTTALFKEYQEELSNKQKQVDQLLSILDEYEFVAITCFEAKHKDCHRSVLAELVWGAGAVHL